MTANRMTAVRLWAGAVAFGLFALAAWVRVLPMAPWEALLPSVGSGGIGYAGGGLTEVAIAIALPLVGNLLVFGEARRSPLSKWLQRLHLAAWLGAVTAAIVLFQVKGITFLWVLAIGITLVPTQLTLLAATYAAAARARAHAAA